MGFLNFKGTKEQGRSYEEIVANSEKRYENYLKEVAQEKFQTAEELFEKYQIYLYDISEDWKYDASKHLFIKKIRIPASYQNMHCFQIQKNYMEIRFQFDTEERNMFMIVIIPENSESDIAKKPVELVKILRKQLQDKWKENAHEEIRAFLDGFHDDLQEVIPHFYDKLKLSADNTENLSTGILFQEDRFAEYRPCFFEKDIQLKATIEFEDGLSIDLHRVSANSKVEAIVTNKKAYMAYRQTFFENLDATTA